MSQLLEYTKKIDKKLTKNLEKNRKIIFGQNFLKRIMSQLLDNTKKFDKIIEKNNSKIIFGSELSEANYEPTFRFLNFLHQIVIADLIPRSRSLKHCEAFQMLYFDKLCSIVPSVVKL